MGDGPSQEDLHGSGKVQEIVRIAVVHAPLGLRLWGNLGLSGGPATLQFLRGPAVEFLLVFRLCYVAPLVPDKGYLYM